VTTKMNMDVKDNQTAKKYKRLTAFAFRGSDNGIDIKIIGCLEIRPAPSQPAYSKGIVTINDNAYSVFDLQALAGLKPKTISDDSCIVLLDPDEFYMNFSRAIIVDDVAEMISIADMDMDGLPVDSIFGCRWQCRPENPAPDFPIIPNEPNRYDNSDQPEYIDCVEKKYAVGRM
jgi:chemotaxis signal transduction protein